MENRCESCAMPVESGRYCPHCVDGFGDLQAFNERLQRMVELRGRHSPETSPEQLRAESLRGSAGPCRWR